jgi:hypothetical protein
MLEKLLLPDEHAIAILVKDHDRVKDLFDRFEKSHSPAEKKKIVSEGLMELKIHAVIEEEVFYPAVRRHVGKDIMNEADEEHHIARVLIAELDRNQPVTITECPGLLIEAWGQQVPDRPCPLKLENGHVYRRVDPKCHEGTEWEDTTSSYSPQLYWHSVECSISIDHSQAPPEDTCYCASSACRG